MNYDNNNNYGSAPPPVPSDYDDVTIIDNGTPANAGNSAPDYGNPDYSTPDFGDSGDDATMIAGMPPIPDAPSYQGLPPVEPKRPMVIEPEKGTNVWLVILAAIALIGVMVGGVMIYKHLHDTPSYDTYDELALYDDIEAVESESPETEYVIDETLLEKGELTDGVVIVKRPSGGYSEIKEVWGTKVIYLANDEDAEGYEMVIIGEDKYFEPSDNDIDEEFSSMTPDWADDEWTKKQVSSKTSDEEIGRVYNREYRLTHREYGVSINWHAYIVYNETSSKWCVVSAFDRSGTKAPVQTVLKSLKFYNSVGSNPEDDEVFTPK